MTSPECGRQAMFHRQSTCCTAAAIALLALTIAVPGCANRAIEHRPPAETAFVPGYPPDKVPVGRELDKVSLPPYTIEPPDVLTITATRVVPKAPYRIRPLDVLQIDVEGEQPEQRIDYELFVVDPGGYVNLGAGYGKVKVRDLSLDEARDAVESHLRRTLANPQVSLTLSESSGVQQITGLHNVGLDGYVSLGTYGQVYVTGLTVAEAKVAIEEHLGAYLEDPQVAVDVYTYGSKVYYVITEGGGFGDNIARFPVTGNETVLDALTQVNGLSRFSSKRIWIARPSPGDEGCVQVLPVKIDDIMAGAGIATNYQILPGDRVFIQEDHLIRADSVVAKLTAPFERVLGFALLGANTVQLNQRFPQGVTPNFGF
ncbi:MAG: polysaccharide biosynthesis/export family protein [Pirellulales bacterium]